MAGAPVLEAVVLILLRVLDAGSHNSSAQQRWGAGLASHPSPSSTIKAPTATIINSYNRRGEASDDNRQNERTEKPQQRL